MSGNFTFPTSTEYQFIVADLVNVTWDITAPRLALYETCGTSNRALEDQIANNYSYVWIATRKDYVEDGCTFMLQPFTEQGEAYGNNITSVTFGVSERYTDDPLPVSYNFVTTSPTASATTTTRVSATPLTTSTSATDNTEASLQSRGLSKASKIGIGLGVTLGILLLAIGGWLLYKFRMKSRKGRTQAITVMNQTDEGIAPLSGFERKGPLNTRLSQAETVGDISQLSSDNERMAVGNENRLSELMSTTRAELY
ncbi:hypothetical protein N7513_013372 [Penicillium frequentans]|nr:hypothetical protein N7513_013372 [Penicillium glabrum]